VWLLEVELGTVRKWPIRCIIRIQTVSHLQVKGVGANLAGLLGQTLLWLEFPWETLEGEWWMDVFGKNSL
jgi:hypothetical protein